MRLYSRLAAGGIRRNAKLYVPYILTCALMAMMFYIVCFLSQNPFIDGMRGGDSLKAMLFMGVIIMGVFSAIFLFYTNSFLVKRRKKEFGLYNVLGLGKRNIVRVMALETVFVGAGSTALGIAGGILFSKLAELLAVRIIHGEATYSFYVCPFSVISTCVVFAGIFLLILLNVIRQVVFSKPVELLHAESAGEKPPRANWFVAVLGALMLGTAYYMAVTIKQPAAAITAFFFAVLLVIGATYLLFIAGSVVMCRVLQKNKGYYYRTKHFISVSQMAYRMRRNGAGLASICILCTMVLVTLSTTICLYSSEEKLVYSRYPREVMVYPTNGDAHDKERMLSIISEVAAENGVTPYNVLDYTYSVCSCFLDGSTFYVQSDAYTGGEVVTGDVRDVFLIPQQDIEKTFGTNLSLSDGEAAIYTKGAAYKPDELTLYGVGTFTIKQRLPQLDIIGSDAASISNSVYVIVNEMSILERAAQYNRESGYYKTGVRTYYGFDTGLTGEAAEKFCNDIIIRASGEMEYYSIMLREIEFLDFLGLYGGLFFLGIVFGGVFILAAVLIMYYKQISEGYDDRARFDILKKVGMNDRDIRRAVNSQVLTVFFAPLIAAGVHMCFAFPMLTKLMGMFCLYDTRYMACVTLACFGVFAALYVAVYAVTSRSYYTIVSGKKNET